MHGVSIQNLPVCEVSLLIVHQSVAIHNALALTDHTTIRRPNLSGLRPCGVENKL